MKNIKILSLVLFAVVFVPTLTGAQTIGAMTSSVVTNVAWPVAIGCVIIFWIITGILFLTAQGAPEKLGLARKALIAAVAGTIIIIIAASACNIIAVSLGLPTTMCNP